MPSVSSNSWRAGLVRVITDRQRGRADRVREREHEHLADDHPDCEGQAVPPPTATSEHDERRAERDRARAGDERVEQDLERRPSSLPAPGSLPSAYA